MGNFWRDVKQGVRLLARKPGFAAVAIITLALGIGANTAIFTVAHALLLKPLPYSNPNQIVIINENKSALELWGLSGSRLVGQRIGESALKSLCPDLSNKIEESHRTTDKPLKFECTINTSKEIRTLAVSLRPVYPRRTGCHGIPGASGVRDSEACGSTRGCGQ